MTLVCLILFTSQGLQIAAPCILSKLHYTIATLGGRYRVECAYSILSRIGNPDVIIEAILYVCPLQIDQGEYYL